MTSAGRRWLRAVSDTQWVLVAQDNSGGVVALPTAAITLSQTGATVHVDGSASFSTTGTIVRYAWSFGDGSTSSSAAVDHTYAATGTYSVTLTVTDSTGRAGSATSAVVVSSSTSATAPTARFTSVVNALTVTLDGSTSTSPVGSIASYQWSFGDNTVAVSTSGATTSHVYATAGTYTATLTVTDTAGRTASATNRVYPASPAPVSVGDLGGNGTQQTGANVLLAQNLTGADLSALVNSAGLTNSVSLQPKAYTFANFAYGTQTISVGAFAIGLYVNKAAGILGAGSKYTSISMVPGSSNKAGDVPQGVATGSASAPTNQLQYVYLDSLSSFVMDGVMVRGTTQGHLYNGVQFSNIGALTISNSTFKGIPGADQGPPGETFSVNLYKTAASSVTTITNVTFDGSDDSGTKVAAVGLGSNSTNGTINVTNLYCTNTAYSSGWASWQQNGTINCRNFVTENCLRSFNAERHGGTSNFYDPIWNEPGSGFYDCNYTWETGYTGGRINFYFTDAAAWQRCIAARSTKKLKFYLNSFGLGNIQGSVHVYVNGVEQTATDYITFSGTTGASTGSTGSTSLPTAAIPGWNLILAQDFTTNAALGSFASAYPGWAGYDSYTDTSRNAGRPTATQGVYNSATTTSVSGGIADVYVHTSGVQPQVMAFTPPLGQSGAEGGQLYGRYAVRFKSDVVAGYKVAWLLWPDSEDWTQGEIDFPEGGLGTAINGYSHDVTGTPDNNAFAVENTGVNSNDWHIAVIEWKPSSLTFILDGTTVGTTTATNARPTHPMHWILQTETQIDATPPATSAAGHVQIDWVAAWSYVSG